MRNKLSASTATLLVPSRSSLAAVISDVIAVFERRLSYKQMHCKPEFRGDLEIFGLQGELRQAVSNLLLNAIDASSNGDPLRIRARETRILETGLAAVVLRSATPAPVFLIPQRRGYSPPSSPLKSRLVLASVCG